MAHINLTRAADAILVAPASADFMAKLLHGRADDLLSLACLARPIERVPLLLAPAMNREMWAHPATQRNLAQVAADGAESWVRNAAGISARFDPYDQLGVVANFETGQAHRGAAFQWFRQDGVLAWLPLPGNRISMVWSTGEEHGRELLSLDRSALCARVAEAGNFRLGELELITAPSGFPLRLMRAPRAVAERLALIGDAAHTIHPLSGHGINLGFQDAKVLAAVLCDKPGHVECGDLALLRRYERARKEKVVALQTVTDSLHDLFGPAAGSLTRLRNFGLNLTNTLPVIKDLLVRYALAS
jgi:ubiquinone biosynthesis UbiH/UbiF/VisC/COQ6 family hydroxylase